MKRVSRELENRILALVDQIIETTMSANLLEGEARANQRAKALTETVELAGLAVNLLEGRADLLPSLVEQLIKQRLPDRHVLKGFSTLTSDLQEIISRGVADYWAQQEKDTAGPLPAETVTAGAEPEAIASQPAEAEPAVAPEAAMKAGPEVIPETVEQTEQFVPTAVPADPVLQAFNLVFPGRQVETAYPFHGTVLAYYLPEEKVAVTLEGRVRGGKARQDYYCRLEGINLITMDPNVATNPWRAAKVIRQAKRQNFVKAAH